MSEKLYYRITYTQGNGYGCGCCRNENTEYEDYDTEEEVIEWLSDLKARKLAVSNKYLTDTWGSTDITVDEICMVGEDLSEKFKPDPEAVKRMLNEFKLKKEAEIEEEKQKILEYKKKKLKKLKEELGESDAL